MRTEGREGKRRKEEGRGGKRKGGVRKGMGGGKGRRG